MSNGKTILEWFNELPEPYKSEAIENMDIDGSQMDESIYFALLGAFNWKNSKQGFDYWNNLHDSLPNN